VVKNVGGRISVQELDYLMNSLKDLASKPNVVFKNIKKLAGFSVSITAFGIIGNNRFNNPYDYLGAFNTTSATAFHVKATCASNPNGNVMTVGVGVDSSYFSFYSGSSIYYLLNPSNVEPIANLLISVMASANNEYQTIEQ
jgi:hypothetical protein